MLALLRHPQIQFRPARWLKSHKTLVLLSSLCAYVCVYVVYRLIFSSIWIVALEYTFLAVFFACVIHAVSKGIPGIWGKILGFRPFLYLGKISYGLYVFHNLAVFTVIPTLSILHLPEHWANLLPVRLILEIFWTVAASALSWHLLESPINNLKRKFPYVKEGQKKSRNR
jgi:peptidoglycan/LPS O-acetylase OafA/YrhL